MDERDLDTGAPDADPHPWATAIVQSQREQGWSEEHQHWSDRFSKAFGSGAYWRSKRAEKRELFAAVAKEIALFVEGPAGAVDAAWWAQVLEKRFGYGDFWILPAAWKRLTYDNVSREVMLAKRFADEHRAETDAAETR